MVSALRSRSFRSVSINGSSRRSRASGRGGIFMASCGFRGGLDCATLAPPSQPGFKEQDHKRGQQQYLPTLLTLLMLRIFQPKLYEGFGCRLLSGLRLLRFYAHFSQAPLIQWSQAPLAWRKIDR